MRRLFLPVLLCIPSVAAAAPDTCEVSATGDLAFSGQGKGDDGSVASDYWMSDDEISTAIRGLTGLGSKMSDAERDAKVAEQMKADPRFQILLLNCQTPEVSLTFGPAKGSKYKDVPMRAGKYAIGRGVTAKPGDMNVLVIAKADAQKGLWRAQSGEVRIAAWDKRHIAGDFEIKAAAGKRAATLKGKFDLPCRNGKLCEK